MATTKRLRIARFAVLCLLPLISIQVAAAQKIAFVASEEILNRLPEVKDARARLAEQQAGWMREIQRQEGEISQLRAQMEANRLLWSVQERRDAENRLKDLEGKLAAFRTSKFDAGGDYEKAHQEIMEPLLRRVFSAIEEEARSQKIDFVFDKSSRGMPMLFASADYDLTAAVLGRLGVNVEQPEAPADTTTQDQASPDADRPRRGRPAEPKPPVDADPNDVLNGREVKTEPR